MAKQKNMVVMGTLYRFGYDLTVAGRTEKEVHDALMAEYDRAYAQDNDLDDEWEVEEYHRLRANAEEDIEYTVLEYGKVEWR